MRRIKEVITKGKGEKCLDVQTNSSNCYHKKCVENYVIDTVALNRLWTRLSLKNFDAFNFGQAFV